MSADPRKTAKQAVSASRYGFDLPPAAPVPDETTPAEEVQSPPLAVVDAHEWDPVVGESAPAPITGRRAPARPANLAASRPSGAPASSTPRATEVSQQVNHLGVPYTLIPGEKKERDTSSQVSESLVDGVEQARTFWIAENYHAVKEHLGPSPRSSAFREALIRLGLKHLDDPEFIDLIPVTDGRRR